MSMARLVDERLRAALAALSPEHVALVDRSEEHRGHGGWRDGGGTHLDLLVVSQAFTRQSRVARHRMVYELAAPLMAERVHALAIRALTPAEFAAERGGPG